MRTIILVSLVALLVGCAPDTNPPRVSADGIYYRVVTIEGYRFIATRGHGSSWNLAGPLPTPSSP